MGALMVQLIGILFLLWCYPGFVSRDQIGSASRTAPGWYHRKWMWLSDQEGHETVPRSGRASRGIDWCFSERV